MKTCQLHTVSSESVIATFNTPSAYVNILTGTWRTKTSESSHFQIEFIFASPFAINHHFHFTSNNPEEEKK